MMQLSSLNYHLIMYGDIKKTQVFLLQFFRMIYLLNRLFVRLVGENPCLSDKLAKFWFMDVVYTALVHCS